MLHRLQMLVMEAGVEEVERRSKRDAQAQAKVDILGIFCTNTGYVKESYSRQRCPRRCSKRKYLFQE